MFNIILYQPEIPQNTGNIIRLCANTGSTLHLVHPLGFVWDDKRLRRAGLDYHEFAHIQHHQNIDDCLKQFDPTRVFILTSKAKTAYASVQYQAKDAFLFGQESAGLPQTIHAAFDDKQKLLIPQKTHSRSLNLSNSVSIMIYEAWRQCNFVDA